MPRDITELRGVVTKMGCGPGQGFFSIYEVIRIFPSAGNTTKLAYLDQHLRTYKILNKVYIQKLLDPSLADPGP